MSRPRIDVHGSVTDPQGFAACGLNCGIKSGIDDFALLVSDRPARAAGVFTTNKLVGAPVIVCREHLRGGTARAIVATSGNANVATGPAGLAAARALAAATGARLGCASRQVLVASTGPIGAPYPLELALHGLELGAGALDSTRAGGLALARALMTTDTHPKHVSVKVGRATIGAAAKGAGMIHPDMATMFCFLTTDAELPPGSLRPMLRRAVDATFNMISVDRDTSTSDSVLLLANGAAGPVDPKLFEAGLVAACRQMARAIAGDGEGSTKLLSVEVSGCRSLADARIAARAVVASNLVKSAFALMPIAGRVLSAVGSSGARVNVERAEVWWGPLRVHGPGGPAQVDRERFHSLCAADEILIKVKLRDGAYSAAAWGCNLTAEYVRCNAEYYS